MMFLSFHLWRMARKQFQILDQPVTFHLIACFPPALVDLNDS